MRFARSVAGRTISRRDPYTVPRQVLRIGWVLVLLLAALASSSVPAGAASSDLEPLVGKLSERSLSAKAQTIREIAEVGDAQAKGLLEALLAGRVSYRKGDRRVVLVEKQGSVFAIRDAFSGEALGQAEKRSLKRVVINNSIRGFLRGAIAKLSLRAEDPDQRLHAVESLYEKLTPQTVELLKSRLVEETDGRVDDAIRVALALAALASADPAERAAAAQRLAGSMDQTVHVRLSALVREEGGDPDASVRAAAQSALREIDQNRSLYSVVETLFFGLSLGSVYVLAAIGLAITFGVMGVINMAHGELMMLGAYTTWVVQQAMPDRIEQSIFFAIPAAFLVSALVGVAIERGVVRFLYGRPLETLLATFGVSLFLQQAVRSIFSPLNRAVSTPEWMSGQYVVNDALSFTYNRLYIILFASIVFAFLVVILRYTTLGLQIRAVSQDRNMARAMGIKSARIDSATFGLGAGVAGLAGVALSQLTNVGPNLGQSHIVDSFMVVVFGGVGNLWGTLVAGLTLGVSNKLLEPLTGAVLAKIIVLVFIVLFIQRRPRGLFPPRGRSAEA